MSCHVEPEFDMSCVSLNLVHQRRLVETKSTQDPTCWLTELVIGVLPQDEHVRVGLDHDQFLGQVVYPDAESV